MSQYEDQNNMIAIPNWGVIIDVGNHILVMNQKQNKWVLRSALNFASDGEIVREVGREFQRKGPEKAKADLAKECLTRVKKKREEEDDRKPGRLGEYRADRWCLTDSSFFSNFPLCNHQERLSDVPYSCLCYTDFCNGWLII
ncbi:hypothetical protein HELRODRAFT_172632 [Helobdella robusta]|uniref:Uncharacterized protein n=1 Tax=Helobdella robusta TaxID=6412 RepID=T1F5P1_HELRO|nr:hypothetical protein HELRODRAFT_172632 [Helobdella robusta]ESO04275.1 hypothetical protein HELRODRAFT_172632 [Helobdella robusta]